MLESHQSVMKFPTHKLFLFAFVIILCAKLFLASILDLYSDEAFYWQASTFPALAYSDLPFMTALLIGAGSSMENGSALAARSLFLILGSCIPFLMYWLAKPITDKQQALESAAISLCLPLGAFLGLLAVPDVPLLFFGLFSLGCFERALRTNDFRYWCSTGLLVALGLSTHYRFFLYPLAAIIFLSFSPITRQHWANSRLWVSIAIASIGLVPIIWFNLANELSSANFYFVDRHPWEFQASGLLHLFKQAGLVTPPLYAVLAFTAWKLWQSAKEGNQVATLLLCFALTNLTVYLVLAPWTDSTSPSIHWPLPGYFPLLVFVPSALRDLHELIAKRWKPITAEYLICSILGLGFTGSLIALIGVGSQAFQYQLQPLVGTGVLSNKMAGWEEFSEFTEKLLAEKMPSRFSILVSDNYYTSAQLEFNGLTANALTLDRDKAVRDGRIAQYQLWGKDESGLLDFIGRPLMFITEDSTLTIPDKHSVLDSICKHVDSIELIDELSLFNGDKTFSFFIANRVVDRTSDPDYRSSPCPYPPRAWIDLPIEGESVQNDLLITGWAFNEDLGIDEIELVIDQNPIVTLNYGIARSDVVKEIGVKSDPNAPNIGFDYVLDSRSIENGTHDIEIKIIDSLGNATSYGKRQIRVNN